MSGAGKKTKAASHGGEGAPAAKKAKPGPLPPAALNPQLTAPETVKALHKQFKATRPFPYMHIHNVFPDDLLQAVRRELLSPACEYNPKANDLYQFEQTDALRKVDKDSAVAKLREFIYSSGFRSWMEGITGIPTNDTLDISAAKYTSGSYLLCHDDDLAERRIAYIIYLVPEAWEASDGGALDIFNCTPGPDGTGDGCAGGPSIVPSTVVASLTPVWNSIAFFEVSAWSHHQVAEVLDDSKGPRLSISGWFHGPPVPRPEVKLLPAPVIARWKSPADADATYDLTDDIAEGLLAAGTTQEALREAFADEEVAAELGQLLPPPALPSAPLGRSGPLAGVTLGRAVVPCSAPDALADWINPSYLKPSTLPAMARHLRSLGSLELKDFLKEEAYLAVMRALGTQRWKHIGPPNLQSFKVALDTEDPAAVAAATTAGTSSGLTPDIVARLFAFMTGPLFGAFVQQLSGLALGGVSGRVRCFSAGDYSMVCDPDYKESQREAKAARVLGAASGKDKKKTATGEDDSGVPVVDVLLRCVVDEEWGPEAGGCTTYLTYDEELLTADVKQNTLSIVLRGPGTMSFVKLVSHKAEENMYDVALSYYPPQEEEDE